MATKRRKSTMGTVTKKVKKAAKAVAASANAYVVAPVRKALTGKKKPPRKPARKKAK